VETVEKWLRPLCRLKNALGKTVGKTAVFHGLVHTKNPFKGATNKTSLFLRLFPARLCENRLTNYTVLHV